MPDSVIRWGTEVPPQTWHPPKSQFVHCLRPGRSGQYLLSRQDKSPGRMELRGSGPAFSIPPQTLLPAHLALRRALEIAVSQTLSLPWRRSGSWRERDAEAAVYKTSQVIGGRNDQEPGGGGHWPLEASGKCLKRGHLSWAFIQQRKGRASLVALAAPRNDLMCVL